jgi:hypothetical protein
MKFDLRQDETMMPPNHLRQMLTRMPVEMKCTTYNYKNEIEPKYTFTKMNCSCDLVEKPLEALPNVKFVLGDGKYPVYLTMKPESYYYTNKTGLCDFKFVGYDQITDNNWVHGRNFYKHFTVGHDLLER